MWSSDESSSETESDPDDEDEEVGEDDLELLDDDAEFVPPPGRAAAIVNPPNRVAPRKLGTRLPSTIMSGAIPAMPSSLPPPTPISAPIANSALADSVKAIREPLEAYGDAVFRNASDHTKATAQKLQDDATKAFDSVVQFHQSAIQSAIQSAFQSAREASNRQDAETANRLQTAEADIVRMRKEIKAKDDQLKAKDVLSEDYRLLHQAALKDKQTAEGELKRTKDADRARRKAAWESHEASKRARL